MQSYKNLQDLEICLPAGATISPLKKLILTDFAGASKAHAESTTDAYYYKLGSGEMLRGGPREGVRGLAPNGSQRAPYFLMPKQMNPMSRTVFNVKGN
jgi:hypothetical protein